MRFLLSRVAAAADETGFIAFQSGLSPSPANQLANLSSLVPLQAPAEVVAYGFLAARYRSTRPISPAAMAVTCIQASGLAGYKPTSTKK